jgi:hypothetical protein
MKPIQRMDRNQDGWDNNERPRKPVEERATASDIRLRLVNSPFIRG